MKKNLGHVKKDFSKPQKVTCHKSPLEDMSHPLGNPPTIATYTLGPFAEQLDYWDLSGPLARINKNIIIFN